MIEKNQGTFDAEPGDARSELRAFMSDLSEEYYCAGWLIGLEDDLWRLMNAGGGKWGMGTIDAEDVAELRRLHEAAGGWFEWDSESGNAVFVETAAWVGKVPR